MRRAAVTVLLGLLALATSAPRQPLLAQSQAGAKTPEPPPKIKIGDAAPDFTLLAYDGKGVNPVSLHDFKGKKNVALAFYVFAFTGG